MKEDLSIEIVRKNGYTLNSKIQERTRFDRVLFTATFNNISVLSWRSVLLMDEAGVLGENHRHVASH